MTLTKNLLCSKCWGPFHEGVVGPNFKEKVETHNLTTV